MPDGPRAGSGSKPPCTYIYDAQNYLITLVHLPTVVQVTEASLGDASGRFMKKGHDCIKKVVSLTVLVFALKLLFG